MVLIRVQSNLVIMGVAGCGKSSLGAAVAAAAGARLIEGDDHHGDSNRLKMQQGIALTDADRAGWLDTLGALLAAQPHGQVLTCSALKQAYRQRLRGASPGLRFVFLDLSRAEAQRRVTARAQHFFASSLVNSQFDTLERPDDEPGVLTLDATWPLTALTDLVHAWWLKETSDV